MIPLIHSLAGRKAVVFGSGSIGLRKAEFFSKEAEVCIVSKDPPSDADGITYIQKNLTCEDAEEIRNLIRGSFIVSAATDNPELNALIGRVCSEESVLFNSADGKSAVMLPSVIDTGNILISISTNGASPALSKYMREYFTDKAENFGKTAVLMKKVREELKRIIPEQSVRSEIMTKSLHDEKVWALLSISEEAAFEYIINSIVPETTGIRKSKQKLFVPLACAGVSHIDKSTAEIEAFRFADENEFLADAKEHFSGVCLLQTCSRVEITASASAEELSSYLKSLSRTGFTALEGRDALKHLLRLASGMESLVVGEDQILGQMRRALLLAQANKASSPVIDLCMNKALHTGIEVRNATHINKGAVSIGSAAVELAGEITGGLSDKKILVVGGGEMGQLVAGALCAKGVSAVYVTNRTFESAEKIAAAIGGKAVRMDKLYECIALSDIVISCTAAPHTVIKTENLKSALAESSWPLDSDIKTHILIDIAQPRDIEEDAGDIPGVRLFTLDDLKSVSEKNMNQRRREAEEASGLIEDAEEKIVSELNSLGAGGCLADLHIWAEEIRRRECEKAVSRLSDADDRTKEVIDDLSKVIIKKLFTDINSVLRECAASGSIDDAEQIVKAVTRGEKPCFRKED